MKTLYYVNQLIAHYERVIKLCSKWYVSESAVRRIIEKENVALGICWCIRNKSPFLRNIYVWIFSFTGGDNSQYWFGKAVFAGENKKEIISLLQQRVDRLKTFEAYNHHIGYE